MMPKPTARHIPTPNPIPTMTSDDAEDDDDNDDEDEVFFLTSGKLYLFPFLLRFSINVVQ